MHVLIALAAGYILLALFMNRLGFEFIQGDTALYWHDSFDLRSIVNPDYLPLYLPILAAGRAITLGLVPAAELMMAVNVIALLAGAWFIYQLVVSAGGRTEIALLGALLYGYWPLIGLPYTVYPRFDVPPMTLLIGGLYFFRKDRLWASAALIGLALVGHKVIVPIGLIVLAYAGISARTRLGPVKLIGFLMLGLLPLGALWIAGTLVHGSPLWLVAWNVGVQVSSRSSLPVLDGAIGTFVRGTPAEIIKGIILAGYAALAAALGALCLRDRPPMYLIGIAICAEIVVMWLALNQFEIWALARFSRLMVLPLVWVAAGRFAEKLPRGRAALAAGIAVLAGTVLSQFVYGWYMVKVFYG